MVFAQFIITFRNLMGGLLYSRPPLVPSSRSSVRSSSGNAQPEERKSYNESLKSGTSGFSNGIPDALAFDKIINGGTCPPCTTRDFMNYLLYIEHAAENLQFYLWLRDYTKRFEQLDTNQQALVPVWTKEQLEAEVNAAQTQATNATKHVTGVTEAFQGTLFAPGTKLTPKDANGNPFATPPRSASSDSRSDQGMSNNGAQGWEKSSSGKENYARSAAAAFGDTDIKWQPYTIQPFRDEISRIIATYITAGSPRELNLSDRDRRAVLHALQNTTHPSAVQNVRATVEWSLRHQAHPNFIRWTICNGNPPRIAFANGLGIAVILISIIAFVLLTLSKAHLAWRTIAAVGMVIGVATLWAAHKGMCVVLHGMHHRHLRPWELFVEEDDRSSIDLAKESFDSSTPQNSYEDEPWVVKYEERNIIRKIFDREVWIREPALRTVQDWIFIQALLIAAGVAAIATGISMAFGEGHLF